MNKFALKLLAFGFCLISFSATCQCWQWGRRGGGGAGFVNDYEKIVGMETDARGNVYVLAQLDGDNMASIATGLSKTDSVLTNRLWGGQDAILIKYNSSGKLIWYKVLGNNGTDNPYSLGMDTLGHLNIAMRLDRNFNIDTDSFANNSIRKLTGAIQYDTAGVYQWCTMPSPDTAPYPKTAKYGFLKMVTMPNGEIYQFCNFGATGLLARSNNVIIPAPGMYILKYNNKGVAQKLIPLPLRYINNGFPNYSFTVTKSGKFIFTFGQSYASNTDSFFIGGEYVNKPVNLVCFDTNGTVLWKIKNRNVSNNFPTASIALNSLYDRETDLIYFGGASAGNSAKPDTIAGIPIINTFNDGNIPYIACVDTLGQIKYLKNGNTYTNITNSITGIVRTKSGKIYASGFGAGMIWDNLRFDYTLGKGYQTWLLGFDTVSKKVFSLDSLVSNATYTAPDIIVTDNKNNIYIGGQLSTDIMIAGDTLVSAGGKSDFFIAKYNLGSCIVPLKMLDVRCKILDVKNVEVSWQTANEVNVHHFNVQRSSNSKDWENVGYVAARNKASNEYRFVDDIGSWVLGIGKVYYRIESVDNDGAKQYSSVKSLQLRVKSGGITVYPNPARDVIYVDNANAKQIDVIDLLGKNLVTINNPKPHQSINVNNLSNGWYIVRVSTKNGDVVSEKVVVE